MVWRIFLDYFSDLAKIYGLQTLFVVTVALGIYCFIRESRRQAKEKLNFAHKDEVIIRDNELG